MSGVWRDTAARSVGPTPCVHQRPPRPVQTGGGRSARLSSIHLVSLGRLLHIGHPGRPSSSWSPLFGDGQSAELPVLSFLFGAVPREDRHLGALKGLLPAGSCWTLLS